MNEKDLRMFEQHKKKYYQSISSICESEAVKEKVRAVIDRCNIQSDDTFWANIENTVKELYELYLSLFANELTLGDISTPEITINPEWKKGFPYDGYQKFSLSQKVRRMLNPKPLKLFSDAVGDFYSGQISALVIPALISNCPEFIMLFSPAVIIEGEYFSSGHDDTEHKYTIHNKEGWLLFERPFEIAALSSSFLSGKKIIERVEKLLHEKNSGLVPFSANWYDDAFEQAENFYFKNHVCSSPVPSDFTPPSLQVLYNQQEEQKTNRYMNAIKRISADKPLISECNILISQAICSHSGSAAELTQKIVSELAKKYIRAVCKVAGLYELPKIDIPHPDTQKSLAATVCEQVSLGIPKNILDGSKFSDFEDMLVSSDIPKFILTNPNFILAHKPVVMIHGENTGFYEDFDRYAIFDDNGRCLYDSADTNNPHAMRSVSPYSLLQNVKQEALKMGVDVPYISEPKYEDAYKKAKLYFN